MKLVRLSVHGFPAARTFDAIVLPAERYATVIGGDEPAIGDGDAWVLARPVGEHGLWPSCARMFAQLTQSDSFAQSNSGRASSNLRMAPNTPHSATSNHLHKNFQWRSILTDAAFLHRIDDRTLEPSFGTV